MLWLCFYANLTSRSLGWPLWRTLNCNVYISTPSAFELRSLHSYQVHSSWPSGCSQGHFSLKSQAKEENTSVTVMSVTTQNNRSNRFQSMAQAYVMFQMTHSWGREGEDSGLLSAEGDKRLSVLAVSNTACVPVPPQHGTHSCLLRTDPIK